MSPRDIAIWGGTLLATVPGPLMWGLVALGKYDPYQASYIMSVLLVVGLLLIVAGPWLPAGDKHDGSTKSRLLDLVIVWTIASTCAQVGWELPFVLLNKALVGVTEEDTWAWLWWAYGIADSRYLISDPFVVVMEGVTSMLGGPLEIWTVFLLRQKRWRLAAIVGLCIAATQWYGTVLYFGTELFVGLKHVNTEVFVDFWFKFLALNALWMVLPLVQGWVSIRMLMGDWDAEELEAAA